MNLNETPGLIGFAVGIVLSIVCGHYWISKKWLHFVPFVYALIADSAYRWLMRIEFDFLTSFLIGLFLYGIAWLFHLENLRAEKLGGKRQRQR